MYSRINCYFVVISMLAVGMIGLGARDAFAVPSYSRQTGLACDACHTVPPQLTAFGRFFKINGYVLSSRVLAPTPPGQKTPKESITPFPPISAMVKISDTYLNKTTPGTQNGSVAFPQALSFYYAGRIAPHLGSFIQITYDQQSDHFGMDMADIRYANHTNLWNSPLVWGITLNNMPTFEDPWNSTPSEGFPFVGSGSAPTPGAAPVVMTLAGNVAGIGAYSWLNNSLYADISVYRTSELGVSQPLDSTATGVIAGVAPYWRFAWEHDWNVSNYTNSWEIGTYGMSAHLYPGGGQPLAGATDKYLDTAIDSQYQLLFPDHSSLTVHAAYIHERQTLDASAPAQPDNHLNTFTVDAEYYWNERFGPSIGYFNITGNTNPLIYSSRTAKPDSSGWILQWTYLPAENVQLGIQYTIYNKFDGASSNYDGTGRSASDNNTLYLFAWFLF